MGVLDNYVSRVYRNGYCINKPGLYKKKTLVWGLLDKYVNMSFL